MRDSVYMLREIVAGAASSADISVRKCHGTPGEYEL